MGELRLRVAKILLGLLPIVHVHDSAVPLQNAPLLVQQRKRARYTPSVSAIGSVDGANLNSVRASSCDTRRPDPDCLISIVRMKKFVPTATHDFFGREAGVIEHANIAVIDCTVRCSAPEHLWNGFSHLAKIEFALPQFLFRSFGVGNVSNEGTENPLVVQFHG